MMYGDEKVRLVSVASLCRQEVSRAVYMVLDLCIVGESKVFKNASVTVTCCYFS